ncbi:MAG: glycosyltransferase family 4 protein [Spirochaetota bacterium]
MAIKNIHQFSAGFNLGDAISNEMIAIRQILKKLGYSGEIYSENIGVNATRISKKFHSYKPARNDLLIYHHSIHSSVLDYILKIPVPKILIYHNVTPHHFFESYDLKLTYYLKKGREELLQMRGQFSAYYADSDYNKRELLSIGYENVKILPIIYDFSKLNQLEDRKVSAKKRILFVARIAPNKRQDDLIKFAKIFYDYYYQDFELNLVGYCSHELESYKVELQSLVEAFDLQDIVKFSDFVDDRTVNQFYQYADLFVTMSEHEGFCVPLLEAMYHRIPIIAHNAGAVKDTLAGSGILFYKKDYLALCEMAYKVLFDDEFRDAIVSMQNEKLELFIQENSEDNLKKKLSQMLEFV